MVAFSERLQLLIHVPVQGSHALFQLGEGQRLELWGMEGGVGDEGEGGWRGRVEWG